MKNTVKLLSLVIIMVLFSCSSESIIESETSLQSVASKAKANKTTVAILEQLPQWITLLRRSRELLQHCIETKTVLL